MYYGVILSFFLIAFVACQKSIGENVETSHPSASQAPTVLGETPVPQPKSDAVRRFDFQNFTYTGPEEYPESFTLKNGKKEFVKDLEDGIFLSNVVYADVTGDAQEEAIIRMTIETGGSSVPSLVFVYTADGNKPKNLWKFISGDRAEGGLKDVYGDQGFLTVEMYGDNEFVNGKWNSSIPDGKFKGLCCPTVYTRTKFRWNGKRFSVAGTPERLDVPNATER